MGSLLLADGGLKAELSRRIGSARAAFNELVIVWKHANLSRQRKVQIYQACVLPRLLYSLQIAWLNKAELQRIDSFH